MTRTVALLRSVVGTAAWLLLASLIVHVIGRQLTRARWLPWLPDAPEMLVLLACAAAGALVVTQRQRATAIVLAGTLAGGLAWQLQTGARLQSDAFYYYAYLRSMTFDHDVSFANDYRLLGLGDKTYLFDPTPTGYAHSAWTIGPAIIWSPFFAVGHLAATRLAAAGQEVATDGTSFPYRQSIVIAGLFYTLLGWWFTLRFAEQWFARREAATAVALMAGGSFMLWYSVVEPTMTHAPSMAAVAGFLWCWAASRQRRRPEAPPRTQLVWWTALGLLAGLMTIIRWQNALFAIVPACELSAALWVAWRSSRHGAARRLLLGGLVFTVAAIVACVPQLMAWRSIYGTYIAISPIGPVIRWTMPQLELTLFSSRNGLFAMSPLLYVAAIGLLGFSARHRAAGLPLLVATAVMVYFNASIQDCWGSDGFGGRRFDGVLPILTLGLIVSWQWLRGLAARRPQTLVGVFLAGAVIWNLTLMSAAQRGVVRLGEAIAFGPVAGDQVRTLHSWIGYPFSVPANWWHALRNDVTVAAYDVLRPSYFLGDPLQPYGRVDIGGADGPLVGEGWGAAEREGDTTFRWAAGDAQVLVPLAHTAELTVQLRLRAFSFAGAPIQRVTIETGRETFGPFEVGDTWQVIAIPTPASAWRAGVNHVRLRFERATRPADVGAGGDTRTLAAAVDFLRVSQR